MGDIQGIEAFGVTLRSENSGIILIHGQIVIPQCRFHGKEPTGDDRCTDLCQTCRVVIDGIRIVGIGTIGSAESGCFGPYAHCIYVCSYTRRCQGKYQNKYYDQFFHVASSRCVIGVTLV